MKAAVVALTCALLVASGLAQPTGSPFQSPPTEQSPPVDFASPPVTAPPPQDSVPVTASPPTGSAPPTGSTPPTSDDGSAEVTDADVLYFAYNLEVLEAQFYSCAATGQPLDSALLGGGPAPNECVQANLSDNVRAYASELAIEETAHVALLQVALQAVGLTPVAPSVDISNAFANAASAAFDNQDLSPPFDVSANDLFFLHGAFIFEDLGVSAYLGALNSIGNSSYRLTAAQIGAAEAYHAALIRTLLYQVIDEVPAYDSSVAQITSAITDLINTVAGEPQLKYALTNDQGAAISNVDSNGLVPGAATEQVLRVVTLGAESGSGGGFFPNNLNGNVRN